jgi:hypothetical protein
LQQGKDTAAAAPARMTMRTIEHLVTPTTPHDGCSQKTCRRVIISAMDLEFGDTA